MLNYLDYYIKTLLGKLDEYTLYIDNDFINILKTIENPIANELIRLSGRDNENLDINYIDIDQKTPGIWFYKQDSKITNKIKELGNDDSIDDQEYRNSISNQINPVSARIGRVIQKLLTLTNGKYKPVDIEDFVNKFIAKQSKIQNTFEIYKGEDIIKGYRSKYFDKYASADSELFTSCMVDKRSEFFNIYTENSYASLLVCKNSNDMIIGRALLWDAKIGDKNIKILDKIYSTKPSIRELFISYANKNKIPYRYMQNNQKMENKWKFASKGKEFLWNNLSVDFNQCDLRDYPYIDTFQYIDKDAGIGYNDNLKLKNYIQCVHIDGEASTYNNVKIFVKIVDWDGEVKDIRGIWSDNTSFDYKFDNVLAGITEDDEILSSYWYDDDNSLRSGSGFILIKKGQKYQGEKSFPLIVTELHIYDPEIRVLTKEHVPNTIKKLIISNTNIEKIEYLPEGLTYLNMSYTTRLKNLTTLPDSLEYLEATNSALETLPESLPKNLTQLSLNRTRIINLPVLPDKLKFIKIDYTKIQVVPALPDTLQQFSATNSELIRLPNRLPDGLEFLTLTHSKVTKLPRLPRDLKNLLISHTSIRRLPEIPEGMQAMECDHTNISVLPRLPNSLTYIDISYTNITDHRNTIYYDNQLDNLRRKVNKTYDE